MGFMTILHGDARFYNNIFVQKPMRPGMIEIMNANKGNEWTDANLVAGTIPYDSYPTYEEWVKQFDGYCGMGSAPSDRYYNPLPVWAEGNAYFNGAKPMKKEGDAFVDEKNNVTFSLKEKNGKYIFETNVYDFLPDSGAKTISTETLGMAFEPEQKFENPDGSQIIFNEDYYGNHRKVNPTVGPFEAKNKSYEM